MHDPLLDDFIPIQPGRRDASRFGDSLEDDGTLLFDEQRDSGFGLLLCYRCLLLRSGPETLDVACPVFGLTCHTCSSCSRAAMSGRRLAISCSHFSRMRM